MIDVKNVAPSIEAKYLVVIHAQEIEISRTEAFQLYNSLKRELGLDVNYSFPSSPFQEIRDGVIIDAKGDFIPWKPLGYPSNVPYSD